MIFIIRNNNRFKLRILLNTIQGGDSIRLKHTRKVGLENTWES
jgi:hypothetical protein